MTNESLARELAEAAAKLANETSGHAEGLINEYGGHIKEFPAEQFSTIADAILAKHDPTSNTPDMEALAERIAELATRTAESLNRGHYIPAMTEMFKPIVRNKLAPLAELLRECRTSLNGMVISYEVTVESIDLEGPAPRCAVEASFDVGTELDEIVRAERLIDRIDNFIGGDNGTGK